MIICVLYFSSPKMIYSPLVALQLQVHKVGLLPMTLRPVGRLSQNYTLYFFTVISPPHWPPNCKDLL